MESSTATKALDDFEATLPALPANLLKLQRSMAKQNCANIQRFNDLIADSFSEVTSVADNGTRTVWGTGRWVAQQTFETARTGFRQVTGQMKAQTKRTAETLSDEVVEVSEELAEQAAATVKATERSTYNRMTKAEVYDMAQTLNIDGRSAMSKKQLVSALMAA